MSSAVAPPVFILGHARSGTTLLRLVLDAHNDIWCPAETYLGRTAYHIHHMCRTLHGWPYSPGTVCEEALPLTRGILRALMDQGRERARKPIWCEKTPDNVNHLELIARLFPDARFVCMYRHGLDVARSWLELKDAQTPLELFVERAGDPLERAIASWCRATGALLDFEDRFPGQCHRLKYEDLVAQPRKAAKAVCRFLAVQWDDALLRTAFDRDPLPGPADPKALVADRVSRKSVGRGANLSLDSVSATWRSQMGSLLERLGYRVDPTFRAAPEANRPPNEQGRLREARAAIERFDQFAQERLGVCGARARERQRVVVHLSGRTGLLLCCGIASQGRPYPHQPGVVASLWLSEATAIDLLAGRLELSEAYLSGALKLWGALDAGLRCARQLLRPLNKAQGDGSGARPTAGGRRAVRPRRATNKDRPRGGMG